MESRNQFHATVLTLHETDCLKPFFLCVPP